MVSSRPLKALARFASLPTARTPWWALAMALSGCVLPPERDLELLDGGPPASGGSGGGGHAGSSSGGNGGAGGAPLGGRGGHGGDASGGAQPPTLDGGHGGRVADVGLPVDAGHATDVGLSVDAGHATDVGPSVEAGHATDVGLSTDLGPPPLPDAVVNPVADARGPVPIDFSIAADALVGLLDAGVNRPDLPTPPADAAPGPSDRGADAQTPPVADGALLADASIVAPGDANPVCMPQPEICNALDDDCDGQTDETTDCGAGRECVAGACVPLMPAGYVRVEPGQFIMGSPAQEAFRTPDPVERAHRVTLTRPFLIKTTEVTQSEWIALMGDNPSHFANCGGDCPVEQVTWFEAIAFCNALSTAEGFSPCYANAAGEDYDRADATAQRPETPTWRNELDCEGYRLPTDAEWEYAARAGTQTATYNGPIVEETCLAIDPNLDPIAWYGCNSGGTTHPVGEKLPNPWGLHDMLGNVWEWSWDWYGDSPAADQTDPLGPVDGLYHVLGVFHVFRGGVFWVNGGNCRAATRCGGCPGVQGTYFGFRTARSVP